MRNKNMRHIKIQDDLLIANNILEVLIEDIETGIQDRKILKERIDMLAFCGLITQLDATIMRNELLKSTRW